MTHKASRTTSFEVDGAPDPSSAWRWHAVSGQISAQFYDYPYKVIDRPEEIDDIPNAYEWHRLQKRPFVLFLTKKLLGTTA